MEKLKQAKRLQISCPDSNTLERMLLEANKHPMTMKALENHLETCRNCQKRVRRIQKFYGILENELKKPVSSKVKNFVDSISKKQDT